MTCTIYALIMLITTRTGHSILTKCISPKFPPTTIQRTHTHTHRALVHPHASHDERKDKR